MQSSQNICVIEHPCQGEHMCLQYAFESIDEIFPTLLDRMDWDKLNESANQIFNCIESKESSFFVRKEELLKNQDWITSTKRKLAEVVDASI